MRKTWVSAVRFSLLIPSQLRTRTLSGSLQALLGGAAHAQQECLLGRVLQREGEGAGARLARGLGLRRAPACDLPTVAGPTSAVATPTLVSATE